MILGTILVLITWMVLVIFIVTLGLALVLGRSSLRGRPRITLTTLRVSLWWGFATLIVGVLAVNLWRPLRSFEAALGIGLFLVAAMLVVLYRHPRLAHMIRSANIPLLTGLLIPIVIAIVFLAFAALGPVTNYDSGLYHLGAIKYSADYSTISGLANLYFPLGYNTSLYPFAALLENGPWGPEGYRLASGLIVTLVSIDLVLRLLASGGVLRRLSAGSWILTISVFLGLVPLVALSDYWVTSPSSDAPVMVLTFAACAYLADGVFNTKGKTRNFSTTFVIAVILFSLRPTMAIFLIGISIIIGIEIARKASRTDFAESFLPLIAAGVIGAMMLTVQTARDYFLSGWFQFPLSLLSFNTPWTAPDPVWNRTATLGNARNPADIWGSVEGYEWIGAWLNRLPDQWETYLLIALALTLLVLTIIALSNRILVSWLGLILILIPSFLSSVTWFLLSPPAFRFGWGPVFSLLIIPIGILLFSLARQKPSELRITLVAPASLSVLAIGLLVITGYTATLRLPKILNPQPASFAIGSLSLRYQATPVVEVPIDDRVLNSGLTTTFPTQSDQCWDNYPLCTPIVNESVSLRGEGIQNGFLP